MLRTSGGEVISIKIEAELDNLEQIEKMFNGIGSNDIVKLDGDEVEIKLVSTDNTKSFDGGFIVHLLLSFPVGVAAGVVGNLIYAALCKDIKKLELNDRRTRIIENSITQKIEEIKNAEIPSDGACFNDTKKVKDKDVI